MSVSEASLRILARLNWVLVHWREFEDHPNYMTLLHLTLPYDQSTSQLQSKLAQIALVWWTPLQMMKGTCDGDEKLALKLFKMIANPNPFFITNTMYFPDSMKSARQGVLKYTSLKRLRLKSLLRYYSPTSLLVQPTHLGDPNLVQAMIVPEMLGTTY